MLYTADVTESKDIEYNHYIQIANSSTKVQLLPNPYLAEGVKLFEAFTAIDNGRCVNIPL